MTAIYEAFATPEDYADFRRRLEEGLGWGDAKKELFEKIESEIGPMREKYDQLMADPDRIEQILQEGARKAREITVPFLAELKKAVGLRNFATFGQNQRKEVKKEKASLPLFKQYREKDGKFYFKLTDASGKVLLQSAAFESGRDAGMAIGALKTKGLDASTDIIRIVDNANDVGEKTALIVEGVSCADLEEAFTTLRQAAEEKANK